MARTRKFRFILEVRYANGTSRGRDRSGSGSKNSGRSRARNGVEVGVEVEAGIETDADIEVKAEIDVEVKQTRKSTTPRTDTYQPVNHAA